jgi:hypothetical protein
MSFFLSLTFFSSKLEKREEQEERGVGGGEEG